MITYNNNIPEPNHSQTGTRTDWSICHTHYALQAITIAELLILPIRKLTRNTNKDILTSH